MFIDKNLYEKILDVIPITCVDIIIKNDNDEILLLKRMNEPAKNEYWFPGGRIFKNESIENCIKRKLKEEISSELESFEFIGFSNTEFPTGPFDKPVHTINLTYSVKIKNKLVKIDGNHEKFIWTNIAPPNLNNEIKKFFEK